MIVQKFLLILLLPLSTCKCLLIYRVIRAFHLICDARNSVIRDSALQLAVYAYAYAYAYACAYTYNFAYAYGSYGKAADSALVAIDTLASRANLTFCDHEIIP